MRNLNSSKVAVAIAGIFAGLLMFFANGARAEHEYARIPTQANTASPLALRVVSYDGATNGEISVEVKNNGQHVETFSAAGLFFVPDGDPDHAPQRLGAVGPFQVKTPNGWARQTELTLKPGEATQLRLDVYCIDSHRSSPSSATQFHLSAQRLPRELQQNITRATEKVAKPYGSVYAPKAKSAVQSEVWKNRDSKWIKVDGEGAQDVAK